jgi:predicted MFS family arabinose efflux permease
LALVSIYILLNKAPEVPKVTHTYHNASKLEFLKNGEIMKMNITNFLQKGFMTFAFMIIPVVLTKTYGWELSELWKVYIPAMIAGILSMGPAAVMAEKKGKFKEVLLLGIVFFALSYYILGNSTSQTIFIIGVIVFFSGFNMHEPIMQSLTTRYAKVHEKGKVLGVFNSFGYFGTFLGGLVGGIYFQEIDGSYIQSLNSISTVLVIISAAWLVLIATLPNPMKKKNVYIDLSETNSEHHNKLDSTQGIDEWYINNTENLLIVKYHDDFLDEQKIKDIVR